MHELNTGKSTFLFDLLIDARFRIWRHLILVLALTSIAMNRAFVSYQDMGVVNFGYQSYLSISLLITYLIMVYFNMFVLVPRLLLTKKYLWYVAALSLFVLGVWLLQLVLEYCTYRYFLQNPVQVSFPELTGIFILDGFATFFIYMTFVIGISVTVLLKSFIIDNQRIHQLENMKVQSEMEQLKEQVNPFFLFKMLNRIGVLATSEPDKASEMLLKLSHLLRYQLYDCGRKKVLLTGEINFLTNYLNLEKLYSGNLEFSIATEGSIYKMLVPPLLFIPFVQQAINHTKTEGEMTFIQLHFKSDDQKVHFICNCNNQTTLIDLDFSKIKQRLELLFPKKYSLEFVKSERMTNALQLELGM
ncbi:histidine kinase [Rapidithrix thailandica]|uniref:Histidine kinase n=1 Tax=Rapidithrix thailandica TaxID=413964 RepID=A0AAW9SKC3_9BACT